MAACARPNPWAVHSFSFTAVHTQKVKIDVASWVSFYHLSFSLLFCNKTHYSADFSATSSVVLIISNLPLVDALAIFLTLPTIAFLWALYQASCSVPCDEIQGQRGCTFTMRTWFPDYWALLFFGINALVSSTKL